MWDAVTTIAGGNATDRAQYGFHPLVMPINEMSGLHYMLLVGVPALGNKSFERRRPQSLPTVSLSLSAETPQRGSFRFFPSHPHPSYTFAVRPDLKKRHEVRRRFCLPLKFTCAYSTYRASERVLQEEIS